MKDLLAKLEAARPAWLRKLTCGHDSWTSIYGGLFADEPGGPKTYHFLDFKCRHCGTVDRDPASTHTEALARRIAALKGMEA